VGVGKNHKKVTAKRERTQQNNYLSIEEKWETNLFTSMPPLSQSQEERGGKKPQRTAGFMTPAS